jgi:hypothetical protein
MRISLFWYVRPCSQVEHCRRFWGICCLLLQVKNLYRHGNVVMTPWRWRQYLPPNRYSLRWTVSSLSMYAERCERATFCSSNENSDIHCHGTVRKLNASWSDSICTTCRASQKGDTSYRPFPPDTFSSSMSSAMLNVRWAEPSERQMNRGSATGMLGAVPVAVCVCVSSIHRRGNLKQLNKSRKGSRLCWLRTILIWEHKILWRQPVCCPSMRRMTHRVRCHKLCIKIAVFWDIEPFSPYVNRCFGGPFHIHHQGRKSLEQETSV